MVATIHSISSSSNAVKYFYLIEKEFESSSSWHQNRASEALSLNKVNKDNFASVLDGKLSKEICLGRKTKEGIKHHPGQELILSAPKSVSIMGLVAKDKRVIEAHERAVTSTLDYVTRGMIYTRIQEKGDLTLEKTDTALIAKFTHFTSRPAKTGEKQKEPDPQLHTHSLIANATLCEDKKWRSIVFDSLYENKMNIGEVYRMELAREIELLGYRVDIKKDKVNRLTFEINGVAEKYIEEFSTRRQSILDKAKELGTTDAETLSYLAKITRDKKLDISKEALEKAWEEKVNLTELENLTKESKEKDIKTRRDKDLEKAGKGKDSLDKAFDYSLSSLSERESVFKKADLCSGILEKTENNYSIKEIEERINQKIASKTLLQSNVKSDNSYTTKENLRLI